MAFNFFRKKKVRFLGRGGLIFKYQNDDYLIDSEMSFSEGVDIVIYKDSVRHYDGNGSISETRKNEIISSLLDCLKNEEHLKVETA